MGQLKVHRVTIEEQSQRDMWNERVKTFTQDPNRNWVFQENKFGEDMPEGWHRGGWTSLMYMRAPHKPALCVQWITRRRSDVGPVYLHVFHYDAVGVAFTEDRLYDPGVSLILAPHDEQWLERILAWCAMNGHDTGNLLRANGRKI